MAAGVQALLSIVMQHEHTRQRAFNCQIASAKARTLDHRNTKWHRVSDIGCYVNQGCDARRHHALMARLTRTTFSRSARQCPSRRWSSNGFVSPGLVRDRRYSIDDRHITDVVRAQGSLLDCLVDGRARDADELGCESEDAVILS